MNIFCNRELALASEYVVMIPPNKPLNPVRMLTGVSPQFLEVLKLRHPNLVAFKKEAPNV